MKNIYFFIAVFIFILTDILTGLIKAFHNGTYKSSNMREGLFHKLGEVMAAGFGILCEWGFPYVGIDVPIPIFTAICIYIILMECGSIVENLGMISPAIAGLLKNVFKAYKTEPQEEDK